MIKSAKIQVYEDIRGYPALLPRVHQAIVGMNLSGGKIVEVGDAVGNFMTELNSLTNRRDDLRRKARPGRLPLPPIHGAGARLVRSGRAGDRERRNRGRVCASPGEEERVAIPLRG